MRRKLIAFAMLVCFAAAPVAAAAPVPITRDSQKDVMITIYNGNLGLVRDAREIKLPPGVTDVQWKDVAAAIDPTTVHLKSLTDPAALLLGRMLDEHRKQRLLESVKNAPPM